MTTKQDFEAVLYSKIKERTMQKKARKTSLPYLSYKSARRIGKQYGFDARPVTYTLISLEKKGRIKKSYDNKVDVYRYKSVR